MRQADFKKILKKNKSALRDLEVVEAAREVIKVRRKAGLTSGSYRLAPAIGGSNMPIIRKRGREI